MDATTCQNFLDTITVQQESCIIYSLSDSILESEIFQSNLDIIIDLSNLMSQTNLPKLTTVDALAYLPENIRIGIYYSSTYSTENLRTLAESLHGAKKTCFFFEKASMVQLRKRWKTIDVLKVFWGIVGYYIDADKMRLSTRSFELY